MSLDIAMGDTICALSSAQGFSAIAIVRGSGPQALAIFHQIFKKNIGELKPFMAMHGCVIDKEGELIDDVMGLYFLAGKSFTGEDSFEIHCHGNQLIVENILQAICAHGGRLAQPGEFSMRAMLNGKIDLSQAESIADLIHAKSKAAQKIALRGLKGGLKEKTGNVRDDIISVLAEIEARMDFPDEDLGGYDKSAIAEKIEEGIAVLHKLLENAGYAIKLHEGARILLCGLPNAGKSTLLNRMLAEERAIVHETAGTTRDVIEAPSSLFGIPIVLVDVAGIRELSESCAIEQIGIERAVKEIERADVIIWLADATAKDPFCDLTIKHHLEQVDVPVLHVLNKVELLKSKPSSHLAISAKNGDGMEGLLNELKHLLVGKDAQTSDLFITRTRQKEELQTALNALAEAQQALSLGLVDEVITSELRTAGLAFDRLFGTDLCEDILDKIFSEFCIGK